VTWLVVGDGDVEGAEEVGEVVRVVAGERRAQVGNRREQGLDLVRLRLSGGRDTS
jgi:hypothetical protein